MSSFEILSFYLTGSFYPMQIVKTKKKSGSDSKSNVSTPYYAHHISHENILRLLINQDTNLQSTTHILVRYQIALRDGESAYSYNIPKEGYLLYAHKEKIRAYDT